MSSVLPKTALITGITGQDGSYLAELLLEKGYQVHGIKRRASSFNTSRIDHLYQDPHETDPRLVLHYGDLTDSTNLIRIIQQVQPDEIYNLGAQSHVAVSFESPEYTANSDALGTLRILEAVRILGFTEKTRVYQASTSELYGLVQEIPQKESTPFYPRSPYGVAKLYAYWITVNYRESYGMYACNGILRRLRLPTVFDALRSAGGVTPYSDLREVSVTRKRPVSSGGEKIRATLNFLTLITEGNESQNIRLVDGDTVVVGRSPVELREQIIKAGQTNLSPDFIQVYVSGRVRNPGSFTLPQGASLDQAISAAGGQKLLAAKWSSFASTATAVPIGASFS